MNNNECLCINLRQASQKITKIYDKALSNTDIKVTQYSALKKIKNLVKPNINQLSNIMKLERSTLIRNLVKLKKMDFISYEYENNNKSKIIRLTLKGNNKISEADKSWKTIQDKLINRLGFENKTIIDLLIDDIKKINL